jgi:hypothetical protein
MIYKIIFKYPDIIMQKMELQTLPTEIEPIEYLLNFNHEILFNVYFVNKYFHSAMNKPEVLKLLHINNDIGRTFLSYTFSDFVYACDQYMLELSATNNDELAISKYKHYNLIDIYWDKVEKYNICYSIGGYIDRNTDGIINP